MTPEAAPNLTPARIFEAMNAYQRTAALQAGIQLAIFTGIAEGVTTAAALAARTGAAERGIRILCDTLVIDGFLTKDGDVYANAPDSGLFLNRLSPAYIGGASDFLNHPILMTPFVENFAETVRRGGTTLSGDGTVEPNNPIWVTFARAMAPLMMPAAQAMADMVAGAGSVRVLDIAAGHGVFGVAIARRNPAATITAVDWAAVLEVAKENAAAAGVASRLETRPGSAFDVEFGQGYDLALITNFLHHFEPEANTAFLRRVHAALKPGGRAVTLEFVPEDDRVTPPMPARFALTMLGSTPKGDAYTFRELEDMLRAAGFAGSVHHRLEFGQSVIISTK